MPKPCKFIALLYDLVNVFVTFLSRIVNKIVQ